ncbi:hypothetical protein FRC02_001293 [Tulasnella sp. 418]|nr:hypothetical protein FRC02_001293 [Tulasnella sp. 418]
MMIQGARLARHNGTRESALRIIDQLLELQPVWLDIQVSFAEGKSLVETAAGKWINKELLQLQGTQQKDPGWLAKELKGAPRSKHHNPQVLFSSELGWPKDETEKTVQEKQGLFTASLMEDSALPTGMYKNPRSKLTGLIATIDQTTKELKVKKIESKQSTSFTFSPVHVLSRNTPSEHLGILTKTSLSLEQSIEINDNNVEDELRRVCALYRQFMEQPSPELTDARKLIDEQHRLLKALLVKTVRDKY